MTTKCHKIAIIGAGGRGPGLTATALRSPSDRLTVAAVVEPNKARAQSCREQFKLPDAVIFDRFEQFQAAGLKLDAAIIATPPNVHAESACALLDAGVPIFLEKPMAADLADARRIMASVTQSGTPMQLGFNLRYAPFYITLQEMVASGRIGQVLSVEWKEILDCHHWATYCWDPSYDRSEIIGSFLMEKCCHDLDLLTWIIGSRCVRVASFGSRAYFNPRKDVPDYCTDGCPIEPQCKFSAYRFYPDFKEADCQLPRWRSRCVFNNGSDHVDHQSSILEYENGVTVAFSLMSLGPANTRQCRICGSEATLVADLETEQIRLFPYHEEEVVLDLGAQSADGHGGADERIMAAFFDYLDDPARSPKTSAAEGWDAMVTAIAIDRACKENRVIHTDEVERDGT